MSFNIYPPNIPGIMMNPYYYPTAQHDYNAHMPAWKRNVTIGGITGGMSIILLIPVVLMCFQMYTVIHMADGSTDGGALLNMMLFVAPMVFSLLFYFSLCLLFACMFAVGFIAGVVFLIIGIAQWKYNKYISDEME